MCVVCGVEVSHDRCSVVLPVCVVFSECVEYCEFEVSPEFGVVLKYGGVVESVVRPAEDIRVGGGC